MDIKNFGTRVQGEEKTVICHDTGDEVSYPSGCPFGNNEECPYGGPCLEELLEEGADVPVSGGGFHIVTL